MTFMTIMAVITGTDPLRSRPLLFFYGSPYQRCHTLNFDLRFFCSFVSKTSIPVCASVKMRTLLMGLLVFLVAQPAGAVSTSSEKLKGRASNRGSNLKSKRHSARIARSHRKSRSLSSVNNSRTSGSSIRWSFGSSPYGYDYLGFPDPYFLFPYSLDPWERGSFRAPDLHDDPYFYDRVPNQTRRSSRKADSTLQLRIKDSDSVKQKDISNTQSSEAEEKTSTSAKVHEDSEDMRRTRKTMNQNSRVDINSSPSTRIPQPDHSDLEALNHASSTFAESLLRYPGGEQWMQYLQPNMLPLMAREGKNRQLNEILLRYDITFVRPEIRMVSRIRGFAESRDQLRRWLQSVN